MKLILQRMIFLTLLAFSFVSCATKTQPFTTNNENAWFLEAGQVNTYPIYCMANRTENSAAPVCYEAKKK
jgi:hypothetical protein